MPIWLMLCTLRKMGMTFFCPNAPSLLTQTMYILWNMEVHHYGVSNEIVTVSAMWLEDDAGRRRTVVLCQMAAKHGS
jgi:hypothetical protein